MTGQSRLERARAALRQEEDLSAGPAARPAGGLPAGRAAGAEPDQAVPAGSQAADDPQYALAKRIALRKLTASARSRAQLAQALADQHIAPEVSTAVLDRLESAGLVDDAAYAELVVRSSRSGRGLARRSLAARLREHGVDDDIAAGALDQLDEAAEEETARALVSKRLRTMDGFEGQVVRRRLAGMLARKGYDASLAYRVIGQAIDAHPAFRRD